MGDILAGLIDIERGSASSAPLTRQLYDQLRAAILSGAGNPAENNFVSAAQTDRTLAMIVANAASGEIAREAGAPAVKPRAGWFRRLLGLTVVSA